MEHRYFIAESLGARAAMRGHLVPPTVDLPAFTPLGSTKRGVMQDREFLEEVDVMAKKKPKKTTRRCRSEATKKLELSADDKLHLQQFEEQRRKPRPCRWSVFCRR